MASGLKLQVVLFIIFPICCIVNGELTAASVYEVLSHSLSDIKNRVDKFESRFDNMDEKLKGFETLILGLKDNSPIIQGIKDDARRSIEIQAWTVRKMIADEKKILRDTVQDIYGKFDDLKIEIKQELSISNASLEAAAEEVRTMVRNSSIALENGFIELKTDLNSTTSELSLDVNNMKEYVQSEINNFTDTLETYKKEAQQELSATKSGLRKEAGEAHNSIDSKISALSSRLSSESSSLSSRIYSVSLSLTSQISSLSSRISEEEERKVGFIAQLTKAKSYYGSGERIIFNNDFYNYGGGYDSSTGIFTAPKSGTYLLIFNIESVSDKHAQASLMVNSYLKAAAYAAGRSYANAGNAAVVYMYAGDRSWIETTDTPNYYIGSYRTQFTGVLID